MPLDFGIDGLRYLLSASDVSNPKVLAAIFGRLSGRLEQIQLLEHGLLKAPPDQASFLRNELARLKVGSGVSFDVFYKEATAGDGSFFFNGPISNDAEERIYDYIEKDSIYLTLGEVYSLMDWMPEEGHLRIMAVSTWFYDNLPRITETQFQSEFNDGGHWTRAYHQYHSRQGNQGG